jgi:predicted hydrocarbon binding protein
MQKCSESSDQHSQDRRRSFPKEVLTFEFSPTRKLAHFVVELSNVPGALEHSASLATKHRVNILSGFHHAPSAAEKAFWSFFADLTDANTDADGFANEIKSLPSTVCVQYHQPSNGLLIDTFHFPLLWGRRRGIMLRAESLGSILARVSGIFGDGPAAKVILHEMGEAGGQTTYDELVSEIGAETFKRELPQVVGLYASNGWGDFQLLHIDFEKKTASLRAKDNFECGYYKVRSTVPRSNFVRGHIAGWSSRLFGSRVEVTETHCVAKGDPCCEFVVQPPTI